MKSAQARRGRQLEVNLGEGAGLTQLVRIEAARQALIAAVAFDEVLAIKDTAERAAVYARQAKDTELIEKATEIKVRAECRAGEMLAQAAAEGQRATGSTGNPTLQASKATTLADLGITRDQSSRYQRLAAMPKADFEAAIDPLIAGAHPGRGLVAGDAGPVL